MKLVLIMMVALMNISCATGNNFNKTVGYVDMDRFMTKWFVVAGRLTFLEKGAHNAVETYTWDKENQRIDIEFTLRKDAFDGKKKSIPQKGWIYNNKTNAHWKVRPLWPFKFDYLIIDLADDYSWTVIGVPSQKWVWIMAKDWQMNDAQLKTIIGRLEKMGYATNDIKRVPQKW